MAPLTRKQPRTKRKGPHPHQAFSAAFCRTVVEAGRYCDGDGLYLHVEPSGAKRWVQRLVIRGRSCTLGLGSYKLVSLSEAREQALANRKLARSGGDPQADRGRTRGVPTFAEAAETVIAIHGETWKRPERMSPQWRGCLRDHAYVRISERRRRAAGAVSSPPTARAPSRRGASGARARRGTRRRRRRSGVAAFAAPAGDCVDHAAYELPHAALALSRSEQAAEVLLDDDVGRLLRPRLRKLDAVLLEQRLAGGAGDARAALLPLDFVERFVSSLVLRLAKASPGLVPLAVFFMFRSLMLLPFRWLLPPPAAALIPCRAPCAWRRLRSLSLAGCARACGSPGRTARTSGTSRAAATPGGCRSGPAALLSHLRCRSSSW